MGPRDRRPYRTGRSTHDTTVFGSGGRVLGRAIRSNMVHASSGAGGGGVPPRQTAQTTSVCASFPELGPFLVVAAGWLLVFGGGGGIRFVGAPLVKRGCLPSRAEAYGTKKQTKKQKSKANQTNQPTNQPTNK